MKLLRLAGLCLALLTQGVRADPALFVVRGGVAPMFVFGSMHFLQGDESWFTPKVRQALKANTSLGVEEFLESWDNNRSKAHLGLETLADLAALMNELSVPDQLTMLRGTLVPASGVQDAAGMERVWRDGDLDRIGEAVDAWGATMPGVFPILLRRRNEKWMETIVSLLERGPSAFITVGAAHLAGPNSLLGMLKDRGYRLERVQ